MKKTGFTKILSLFLSLILAFSAFGIVVPTVFAEGAGSVTDALWNTLANALRSDNVKNANYGSSNNVTVDDPSGDITAAAKAYFAVFNAYVHKATSNGKQSNQNEYNLGYRTSQQVRDLIKNKMSSLMGADYTTYNSASVLNKLGGPNVSSSSNTNQSSVPTTSFTIKVTNSSQLTNFATLDDVAAVETYSYTISHRNGRYYETTHKDGCKTVTDNNYYAVVSYAEQSSGTGTVDIALLRAYETALNNNASVLDADQAGKIELGYDALAASFQAITTAKGNAVNKFGEVIVQHFFGAYEDKIDALEAAMKIAQYKPFVDRINAYIATDISAYDLAALTEIYEALKADYDSYKAIGIEEVYTFFEVDNNLLDRAVVDEKYAEIENAYQIAYLREVVKPTIEENVETYKTYDADWVLATDNADVPINEAIRAIEGYQTALSGYKAENVAIVFGDNYDASVLAPLKSDLNELLTVNNYKTRFEQYKTVYTQAFEPVSDSFSTDQLYGVLSARDAWYSDLQAYVAELREYDEELANKILGELGDAMDAKIKAVYDMLKARISETIGNAYDLYQGFVAEYGYTINTSDDVTVQNYNALRSAFGLLNPAHYQFFEDSPNAELDPEIVREFEEIRDAVFAFVNFDASKGLSAYKYNKEYIADIIRQVSARDVARNADYTVTDEKVEAIIDMLENLLGSDAIKEKFDLSGTVSGLSEKVYTDEFLNTLVQYIYPMVVQEFAKVWSGIPNSVDTKASGLDVHIDLSLDSMATVLGKIGLAILPPALANKVGAYPEAAALLRQATAAATWDTQNETMSSNPWTSDVLCDEEGKLKLVWGITDRESFLDAAAAALSGLDPLLHALLLNKNYSKESVHIGTGEGSAGGCVDVHVTSVKLTMKFAGNNGYNNAVAPILVGLGANNIPDGTTFANTRDLLSRGVVTPLKGVLETLADKPLDTIIRLLPNLAFAFNLGLVEPLLNELKTSIQYWADADYNYKVLSTTNATMSDATGSKDSPIAINLGEMLPLDDLGINLKSLNGLLNSVLGLLTKPEEEPEEGAEPAPTITLPAIDEAKLSMLGDDVEWIPGHRTVSPFSGFEGHASDFARIVTDNRADVFLFLIDYLMKGMTKPEGADENWQSILDQIIALLNAKQEETGEGTGEEPIESAKIEISEALQGIIDNIVNNYTDSLAAIVELLFPQKYNMGDLKHIDWITEGNFLDSNYEYWTEETAAEYDSLWTREEAVFVESHIEDILNYLVALFSDELGGAKTLPDAANALIGGLYTAETANKIPAAIKNLLGGLELPEAIADLGLFEQLGIDLTAWDNMTFSFENGDKDAFKAALVTALNPLSNILAFILAESDIELTLLDAVPVKALGYDGYSYGIVPILEALGASGVKTTDAFKADKENIVQNIVDPLFSVIDHLTADPLAFIQTVLPNIVYFNASQGIQTAVPNLLFAVNVLLDTIRPVYDVNLYELVDEKLGFDLRFLETDPLDFLLTTVAGIVEEKAGITLDIDFTAADICDTLHFTTPEQFTSANGDPAYRIALSADGRADLLSRTLDYVILQVLYEDNYDKITELVSGLFGGEGVPEIMTEILTNVKENYPDSIVAVVRFLFPDKKDMRTEYNTYPRLADKGYTPLKAAPVIDWIKEGNVGSTEEWMSGNDTPDGGKTLWTKEKAVYMAEHIGDFLNDVVVIFGDQLGGAQSFDQAVDYLITGLLTAENANKIVDAIKNLVASVGLPDTVFDVAKQLGIDLHAWDEMHFEFADGDKTAFKNALITALKPVEPVLRMILVDGGDLEATVFDAIPVKLLGYDGYSYGIVPLLEALGASGVKSTSAFKADKVHVVENIVNPLFTVIDHLTANPIGFVEEIIPSLIFFDKNQGIQVAIPNLLYAVNVILDTIYPIYPIDIYELVEEKTDIDLHFAEESPVDFLLTKVAELIKEKTDVEIKIDFTVESLSQKLHFTDPEKFTSANGDDAYRIHLTTEGKAELLSDVLDYGINQVIFEDNFDRLSEIFSDLITDDDTRAFVIGLLDIMKHADDQYSEGINAADYPIHDVALAQLFWIFFGADSVTDAVSDFFYRYREVNFFEILYLISDKAPDYIQRIEFLLREIYAVEYPAALDLIENAEDYLKPPYEYNDHETKVVSGVLGRILAFFVRIIDFFRHLFNK